ncbi:MAG: hypothetical protein K0T00_2514 [Gaiellaceae bacterium]|jgi:hypothetical protein|nr:hypothetical protein [Gaiellaceae bacterium]
MSVPPLLVGVAVAVVAGVAGVVLIALDFDVVGFVVTLASVPAGLIAWVVANDRA